MIRPVSSDMNPIQSCAQEAYDIIKVNMKQVWHVIGYTWRKDGIYLLVREPRPGSPGQELKLNGEVYLRKINDRRCVGWIDFTRLELMPCPDNTRSITQCESCKQREGFIQCVMCNGFSCPPLKPSVQEYCRQEHHLYLACFGDNRVKVGTASNARKKIRIWEQGPLAAVYVASAPGPTIKQIEHVVSGLGYAEAMQRSEKKVLLTSGMEVRQAENLIVAALQDIRHKISSSYLRYFHEPESAERPRLAVMSRTFSAVDNVVADVNQIIGGQIVAASGGLLIFEDNVGPFVLDLATLKSWLIEVNPDGPRPVRNKQLSLF